MHDARSASVAFVTGCVAVIAGCAGPVPRPDPIASTGERCAALATLDLIDMKIVTAELLLADADTPAHCRVAGVIETEIGFELLLPDDWNGRLVVGGGGGFVGSVQNQALEPVYAAVGGSPLARGYATVGTDTGHVGSVITAAWALNNPERRQNFGHRAVHLTSDAAKSVISHYYDEAPQYSYFVGCSRGGGQGMMESQRYPNDFDGIVAGAPAYDWTALTAGMVQTQQAMYPDGDLSRPVVSPALVALLTRSIDAACDLNDGIDDGVLHDPQSCDFTLDELPRCIGDDPGPDCVTAEQLRALTVIYRGPRNNGASLFAGFPFGGENDAGGWDTWITGSETSRNGPVPSLHFAFGTQFYKYFVFNDPEWDYTTYDFSTWAQDTAAVSKVVDATDTDLRRFDATGGKMIFWTGWSDPAITALGTIDYYDAIAATGSDVSDFARLFLLPGVLHCGGGSGPDAVDWVEAIRAWVEDGQAPERLSAHKLGDDQEVETTRPVCAYPQVAVYDGQGDLNTEDSFACQSP